MAKTSTALVALGIFAVLLVSALAFLWFAQQTFLPVDTRFILKSTPDGQPAVFLFDGYELRATARNGYYAATGCQPLGSSPCGSCSDLGVDSYGCPRRSCQIPQRCDVECRSYRCSWQDYYRQWYHCGNFKCYDWNSVEVKASRWGDVNINSCDSCGTSTEDSGGMQVSSVNGCVSKFDLYYKGNKIYEFTGSLNEGYSRDTVQIKLRNGVVNPESVPIYTIQMVGAELPQPLQHDLALYWGGKESRSDGSCVEVSGEVTLSPPADAVLTSVKDVPDFLFNGQYANITLTTTNSWRPLTGTLFIDYIIPTLIGNATRTESMPITLPVGTTTFSVAIPTEKVTDQVLMRPRFELSTDLTSWQNVLTFDRAGTPSTIQIGGQIVENWTTVQIVPKPLYIVKPAAGCQGDYIDSITAPGYCVLNTLKELTCYQIGCPQTDIGGEQVNYECTSSGLCAQTIFVDNKCKQDADCQRLDAKCDVGTGLCIQEKIFENILQCKENTDCAIPCTGKTASCEQSRCAYSGECDVIKLPAEVIEKIVKLPPEIVIQKEIQIQRDTENVETLKNAENTLVVERPPNFWPFIIITLVVMLALALFAVTRKTKR